jgi:tetratricopeptide (TPR) repeat protein
MASNLHLSGKSIFEKPITLYALWGLLMVAMTIMSFSYGISGDEVDMNEYGKTIWQFISSFGSDRSVFRSSDELNAAGVYNYNRDNVIQYYGGLFDLICALVNKVSPFDEYTTRHILNAWAGFLAIVFVGRILKRLLGMRATLIGTLLMALSPFFMGHAMNNPKDVPFATAYIMAIYFMLRLFDRLPKPSWRDYLWVILCIGATINIRVGGILLLPYLGVFAVLHSMVPRWFQNNSSRNLMQYVKPLAITAVLGYLCGSLLWPYGIQNPISNPLTALSEMSNFKVNLRQLYEGTKQFSGELPLSFLPKSFVITNTFAVLAGLVLMLPFIWGFRKHEQAPALYFVLFTGVFPFLYILYTHANVYHAWRHVLFIFPSLMVMAAFGWDQLMAWMQGRNMQLAGAGLLGFLLLDPLYFMASTFPNTVTYHNQLVGGVKGAYGQYEVDYYYNSVKQAADWFKANELQKIKTGDTVRLYSNAAHILTHYFKNNKNVVVDYVRFPERNQKNWDYALFHIALIPETDIQQGSWMPSSTIYKAQVQGNTLCILMKRPSHDDMRAMQFLEQQQPDSALVYFEKYLQKDPGNTDVLATAAQVAMQSGKSNVAQAYIEQAYKADPNNPQVQNMYGILLVQQGKYPQAQAVLVNLLQKNPQFLQGFYYLAEAQLGMGNAQQALQNLNTAAQDPQLQAACYQRMAQIYMQQGNTAEAQRLMQAASRPQ